MATFVFPTDAIARRSVDTMFEPQWNAAQAAGHQVALLDFDSIEDGLRTVGEFGDQPVILRGWMMTPKVYRRLEVQLQEQGITLPTSADLVSAVPLASQSGIPRSNQRPSPNGSPM